MQGSLGKYQIKGYHTIGMLHNLTIPITQQSFLFTLPDFPSVAFQFIHHLHTPNEQG